MAGFHTRMRNMVIRRLSLKNEGVPIIFSKSSGGDYDPVTGGVTPITQVDYIGSGVRVNYKESAYKETTIVYGDFQIYLSPVQSDGTEMPKPEIGDEFLFNSTQCRVINVIPFNDNADNCGWKLQVRNG